MKSIWRVTSNMINGKRMYAVVRSIDKTAVDHSGNRQHATGYIEDRTEAESIAKSLNLEDIKEQFELGFNPTYLMNEMEKIFSIPALYTKSYIEAHPDVMGLYRKISNSRSI